MPKQKTEINDQVEEETNLVKGIDIPALQGEISEFLHYSTFEPEQKFWLDSGSPDFNAVMGSETQGMPYGKIYEIAGEEHSGKTVISTILAGIAQRDGAPVGYIDAEDSRDEDWAEMLGLEWRGVLPIYSKLVKPKKSKGEELPRLQGAEELFAEAEVAMARFHKMGFEKQFWMLDSIANIQTVAQGEAGTTGQNMRTKVDRAMFLADVLPRWAGLAANYNAMIILINQLREKVGMVFGDPSYTPGGRSLRHNCAVRTRTRRHKGGRILSKKHVIGLRGIIKNYKNKAGKGSVEGRECGYEVRWNEKPAKIIFMPVSELEEE